MSHSNHSPAQALKERTITSLEIAEISGRNHRDLLRSIKNQEVAWRKVNGRNFALVEYADKKGELRPMYRLTQKESLYISSKFNDEQRAKLVLRWFELETQMQKPLNGIYPIVQQGNIGFPRKEILQSVGRNPRNGYRLRKRYGKHCFFIGRTACISPALSQLLIKKHAFLQEIKKFQVQSLNLGI